MVISTKKMGGLIATHLTKGEKMKYLILQDTVANKEKVKAGDVVELQIDEGRSLVGYGKATEYKGKEKKETNRSVGLKTSEVKAPKKRAKK
jgi:DNA helicase TIP49 (TBP-interacting protein)|tara:strand:- start:319 stop:591 length:273 start_codon:yes stop_codon:yes gene_type:complete